MWNSLKALVNKMGADANSYQDVRNKIKEKTPTITTESSDIQRVINYFLYIGGIVAVVMAIIAGIQMTMSAGDPGAVKKAKNTLMWSIVGLVIMILAYAIVNFVIGKVVAS